MSAEVRYGDALKELQKMQSNTIDCCVTSPPYWGLRDYDVKGQIGLERTPEEYVTRMVEIFREVRRVITGTLWLNLGDSYTSGGRDYRDAGKSGYNGGNAGAYRGLQEKGSRPPVPIGLKAKDLVGIPWRVAFALQYDGWYLRSDIIWSKPNAMPESVTDRPTKSHEYLFMLAKSASYYYDAEAIKEPNSKTSHGSPIVNPGAKVNAGGFTTNGTGKTTLCGPPIGGRNKRTVWTISTQAFPEAHFATFPEALIEPCILAGCAEGGTVLDPFCGSGTTGVVALRYRRNFVGIELNPAYVEMARCRIAKPDQVFLELSKIPD